MLFNLLDGSIPFSLENRSVRVYAIKPDGTEVFNDLIITDAAKGYCILELTTQMLAVAGTVKLELMVIEGEKKLTSNIFYMDVKKSINSEKAVVSTNEFGTLLTALASLDEYDNYKNEIKNARGGQVNLKTRLDNFGEQLDNIETEINSLSFFPRLANETDDYNRILRAIDNTKTGGVIKFPSGTYELNANDIVISKSLTIIGDGIDKTIFSGGSMQIESSNVNISDLTVLALSKQNAFQCNNGSYGNIRISRCKGSAISHSFLFESYNGTVQNIICDDCISINSIHGFISKAYDITFKNCKAYNHISGFGFGIITDNIPSETQIGACSYNNIINCEANNCSSGVRSYCRDKYSSNTTLKCNNNNINGFKAIKCNTPISIGEDTIPDGYQAISRIEYYKITGVFDEQTPSANAGIILRKTYRCIVDDCIINNGLSQTINAIDNIIGNVVSSTTYPNTAVIPLLGSTIINTSLNSSFEIVMQSGTSSSDKITLAGTPRNGNIVTVLVRHGGFNSFGGFDTSNLIIDTTKFTINTDSYIFNHGQITQWLWMRSLSKWLCIYASGDIALG